MPRPSAPLRSRPRQSLGMPSDLTEAPRQSHPHPQYQMDRNNNIMAASDRPAADLGSHDDPHVDDFGNMDDLRLSYSLMDDSMSVAPGTPGFFLDMYPQLSHDDSCLDNCQTIAVFNGSRLPHRGGTASALSRQFSFSSPQFAPFDGQHAVPPAHFQQHQHQHQRTASDSFQKSIAVVQDHHDFFGAELDRDEDPSAASSCCDSDCNMPDKCTDVSCENTTNACNDQNCPERSAPHRPDFDVANGAAALISINHAQEFQPAHAAESHSSAFGSTDLGLNETLLMGDGGQSHGSYHHDTGTFSELVEMRDITAHVFSQHGSHGSSGCRGPSCLVDSMPDFSVCHLPSLDNYRFFDQYAANSFFPGGYTECGSSIPTPEAFVHHFNECHRHQLVDPASYVPHGTSSAQLMATSGLLSSPTIDNHSLPQSPLQHFSSMATMSGTFSRMGFEPQHPTTSSSNTIGSTTSPESSSTIPKTPPSDNPETPRTDVTMGPDWEHKCQWRDAKTGLCGKVFDSTTDLFDHVNAAHVKSMAKGDGGYLCQWDGCCRGSDGKGGFPQRSKIERHMQTHVGYKPHTCDQCGAGFSAKQALDQHQLIHSDQKPLQCPTCGKKIRHQSALTMHMRTHTGEKPLKCNICGKRFSESSNLSKHKRTHDEKGRFSCGYPGCDANFHRQDQLRRHRNNCHKDDGEPELGPNSEGESQLEQWIASSNSGPSLNRPLHGTSGPTPSFDKQTIRKVGAKGVGKHARAV
ncbi:hypothetical protein GQ53DRAFT_770362 [Thozetella sp. PMI_491]|nr:hypothetical protein GQ53DRAFT_770362 [Thozetella sp. PMI_491]